MHNSHITIALFEHRTQSEAGTQGFVSHIFLNRAVTSLTLIVDRLSLICELYECVGSKLV